MSEIEYFRRMPKVELHVHLEGATRPETLMKLALKNGITLPHDTLEGLGAWCEFSGFDHFLQVYMVVCSCIKNADDIEQLCREFLDGQAEQNIIYTEFTYTAWTHHLNGISIEDQMEALGRARAYGMEKLGISCGFVLDIPRHDEQCKTVEKMNCIAEWCIKYRSLGVVALGLAGDELACPARDFKSAFDIACAGGVGSVPHAGEIDGAESVRQAITFLRATRVGHGVRCIESEEVVDLVVANKVVLEVCPTSNVCLGVVPNMASHPLPELLRRGVLCTINSDDPALFSTTLTNEYVAAFTQLGLTVGQIEQCNFVAAEASHLDSQQKQALVARLQDGFNFNRQ